MATTENYDIISMDTVGFDYVYNYTRLFDNMTTTVAKASSARTSNQIMSPFLTELYVYMRLILPSLSIVLNSLSIVVFLQRRSRKATVSVFLIALAVADILSNTATFYKEYIARLGGMETSNLGCKVTSYMTSVGKMCAVWLNVFYTTERFISVKYVFKRSDIITPFRAKLSVLLLALAMMIEEIYTLYWYQKKRAYFCDYKILKIDKVTLFGVLFKNRILNFLIPFTLVAVMNGMIVHLVRKAAVLQGKSSSGDRKEGQITIMLVSLSVTSFLLQLPSIIAETMMTFHLSVYFNWLMAFYLISKMLSHIDHSTNFFFYIIAGTAFRKDFIDVFTCGLLRNKKESGVSSNTSHTQMSKTTSISKDSMATMSKTTDNLSTNGINDKVV